MLHGDWTGVLHDIGLMGTVITVTEHPLALLAVAGCYPEIDMAPCGLWATTQNRHLALDLTSWREVHWIEKDTETDAVRSIEVMDRGGNRVHTIVLLSELQADEFRQLLENYHHPTPTTAPRTASAKVRAPWQAKFQERRTMLSLSPGTSCTRLPVNSLPGLFQLLQQEQLNMLMGVYTPAVIHRHAWKIERSEVALGYLQAWGDDAALRLSLNGLDEIWLICGRCGCCGEDRLTIEAYDSTHKLVFAIQAENQRHEAKWRELVRHSEVSSTDLI